MPDATRGFAVVRFLWRLLLWVALGAALGMGLKHQHEVMAVGRSWASRAQARLQMLMPVGALGGGSERVAVGYQQLQENSMVSLYTAAQLFAAAAVQQDHDVAARAGQADAQVALAFAYGSSADLMARYAKTLRGPQRRAADRLVREERRQQQDHLQQGQQFAKEALRMSPVSFAAQRAMAGALLQGGRNERARHYLAQARTARPQDIWVRQLQADQTARQDVRGALPILMDILASEPNDNAVRYRLALLRWQLNDRAGARQDALMILARSPGHALARRLLTELEPLAGEGPQMARLTPLPRAEDVAQQLPPISIEDGSPGALTRVLESDKASKARATMRVLLQRGGQAASVAFTLCAEYSRTLRARVQHLVSDLMATQAGPESSQDLPAVVHAASGVPDDPRMGVAPAATAPATSSSPKATQEASTNFAALVAQAQTQQRLRNRTQAEALWRRALALNGNSVEVLVALGWCGLQAHDTAQALGFFNRAAGLAPRTAEVHFGLAEAKRMAQDTTGAQEGYRHYLALEPRGPLAPLCHQMLEELGRQG